MTKELKKEKIEIFRQESSVTFKKEKNITHKLSLVIWYEEHKAEIVATTTLVVWVLLGSIVYAVLEGVHFPNGIKFFV